MGFFRSAFSGITGGYIADVGRTLLNISPLVSLGNPIAGGVTAFTGGALGQYGDRIRARGRDAGGGAGGSPPPLDPTTPTPPDAPPVGTLYPGNQLRGGGVPVGILQLGYGARFQSPATRHFLAKASGARGGRTTQRRRKKKAPKVRRASARRSRKPKKLVKGSRAAKLHMAKLRRMRK